MILRLGKSVSTFVGTVVMNVVMNVVMTAVIASSLAIAPAFATTVNAAQRTLNIYNWSDYIAEDTIANFEKETGMDDDIRKNPGIYPTTEAKERLFVFEVLPSRINRQVNRMFTKLTSGQ